jgi:competence protein ComEA
MDILRKAVLLLLFAVPAALYAAGQAVNINTADKAALMTVKGVGERRAEAIIEYREKHGPFKSVEQLLEVQGVGESILQSNRDRLTVQDVK